MPRNDCTDANVSAVAVSFVYAPKLVSLLWLFDAIVLEFFIEDKFFKCRNLYLPNFWSLDVWLEENGQFWLISRLEVITTGQVLPEKKDSRIPSGIRPLFFSFFCVCDDKDEE